MAATPKSPARPPARKATARKATASTTAARKSTARKSTARKSTARKATASASTARKAPARTVTARTAPARKAPARTTRVASKASARASTTAGTTAKQSRASAPRGPDAISLLTHDHRTVAALFDQLLRTGEQAKKKRTELVQKIVRELSVHAAIEETAFYPFARKLTRDIEKQVLESLEEHHVTKWILDELSDLDVTAERFLAKATVLKETVQHHVDEEESELFPKVRKASTPGDLADVARALEAAKHTAPTRPHPRAPDTPPANVVNQAVGLVDRVRDKARDVMGR